MIVWSHDSCFHCSPLLCGLLFVRKATQGGFWRSGFPGFGAYVTSVQIRAGNGFPLARANPRLLPVPVLARATARRCLQRNPTTLLGLVLYRSLQRLKVMPRHNFTPEQEQFLCSTIRTFRAASDRNARNSFWRWLFEQWYSQWEYPSSWEACAAEVCSFPFYPALSFLICAAETSPNVHPQQVAYHAITSCG